MVYIRRRHGQELIAAELYRVVVLGGLLSTRV